MTEKKAETRFTIQLNQKDPSHIHVAEILNRLGRKKAKLIVDSIIFYEQSNGRPIPQAVDIKTIEAVVNRLLAARESNTPLKSQKVTPTSQKPYRQSEELIYSNTVEELDDASINAIASALDAFMDK